MKLHEAMDKAVAGFCWPEPYLYVINGDEKYLGSKTIHW